MKQIISFSRNKVVCANKEAMIPEGKRLTLLATLRDELAVFGYGLDNEVLLHISEEEIMEVMNSVLPELRKLYHSGSKFQPLYPGFPAQVISKTNEEMLSDRDAVYNTSVEEFRKNNPWYEPKTLNPRHFEIVKWLGLMTTEEFMGIPTSIMSSNSSLADNTKKELEWFLNTYKDLKLPATIPFKETLCIVSDLRPDLVELKDINDVLKFAYYKMGVKDLKLTPVKKQTKTWRGMIDNSAWRNLGSLIRKDRKNVLERIEKVYSKKGEYALIDAKKEYGHWILLSERIHSGDYKTTYPMAREFFEKLQGNFKTSDSSFYSKLQSMYDNGEDIVDIASFLATRPGEFVRRFDSVIRRAYKEGKEADVFGIFLATSGFKNRTLLSLLNYYERRDSNVERFVRKPDGTLFILPKLESFNKEITNTISDCIFDMVLNNVEPKQEEDKKLFEGKAVWIDPKCKDVPVPLDMRGIESTGFNVIPRGTKFDIPENKNFIRFFVHWVQKPNTHEDLDLHAFLTNEDGTITSQIGWNTNLTTVCASHSGDVIDQPGDCAEFVDIDIEKCLESGFRYVTMDVVNYRRNGFDELPVWLGYTYQNSVQKGENLKWVPRDVEFCAETNNPDCRKIFAWLFDLKERKAILIQSSMDKIPVQIRDNQFKLVKYFTAEVSVNCSVIAERYYSSRGATLVTNPEDITEDTIKVTADEICLDYTKTLEMLGE